MANSKKDIPRYVQGNENSLGPQFIEIVHFEILCHPSRLMSEEVRNTKQSKWDGNFKDKNIKWNVSNVNKVLFLV